MEVGQKAARRLILLAGRAHEPANVCSACRYTIHRRRFASAAAAVADPLHNVAVARQQTASTSPTCTVKAGVVLSRPPLLTRDLTQFEKAFFFYQRRLNERLVLPFTRYFYFKKETPADIEWKRKVKIRQTPARDIGVYNPYSKEGWNDELLVGAEESEPEYQLEAILKDAEVPGIGSDETGPVKQEVVERPTPRVTEADRTNDQKSLNRKLARTLYLLVKNSDGQWSFPADTLVGREHLHQAAERILVQSGGVNMNTWIVGHTPIGHIPCAIKVTSSESGESVELDPSEKTFFIKARIMAGQAELAANQFGLTDFKWLSKEEIEEAVSKKYWKHVKNMLVER